MFSLLLRIILLWMYSVSLFYKITEPKVAAPPGQEDEEQKQNYSHSKGHQDACQHRNLEQLLSTSDQLPYLWIQFQDKYPNAKWSYVWKIAFILVCLGLFFIVIFFLIFYVYFWGRQRERQREIEHKWGRGQRERETQNPKQLQASRCQHRAQHGARTHEPWDRGLSQSWTLNRLSHPGATLLFLIMVKKNPVVFTTLTISRYTVQ